MAETEGTTQVSDAPASTQEATHAASPAGDFRAEDFVTPELKAKFDEVFGKDGDVPAEAAPQPPAPPQGTRRPRRVDETSEQEDETLEGLTEPQGSEPDPDEPTQPQPPARRQTAPQEAPATLTPLLRQAAKRTGWTDTAIENFYKASPSEAVETFRRIHSSLNEVSARFASFAQPQTPPQQTAPSPYPPQGQPAQTRQPQSPPPPPPAPNGDVLSQLFGPDYTQRLADRYGEQFVPDVLEPLKAHVLAPVQQMYGYMQQQMQQQMQEQVEGFFQRMPEEFKDSYGDRAKGRLNEQQDSMRYRVCQVADQIRTGANMHGVPMSVADALEQAHSLVASEQAEALERKRLTGQVRQRSSAITAKPTQRSAPSPGANGQRSDRAAMEAYEAKARELGMLD